jgi:signal transduction histidine kinase/ligand-binding sensor domain-containing protein
MENRWLKKLGSVLMVLTFFYHPASAMNPDIAFIDYHHRSWTNLDGAPADINAMAQTPDGWLWLGTSTGLYRFDGLHFEYVSAASTGDFPKRRIGTLRAETNGNLWIAFDVGGLSVRHPNGKVEPVLPLDSPVGVIAAVARDASGRLIVAGSNGMFRLVDGKAQRMDLEAGAPVSQLINSLVQDQYGRIWVLTPNAVYRLDPGKEKFSFITPFPNRYGGLTQSLDGSVWVGEKDVLTRLPSQPPPGFPEILNRKSSFNWEESRRTGQFDRDGNLWFIACPDSLCVVGPAAVRTPLHVASQDRAHIKPEIQLSSRFSKVVMEDREGNVWVATRAGLDRWRENRLVPVRLPHSGGLFTMASDTEGASWLIDELDATAWRFMPGKPPLADRSAPYTATTNDRRGALLLASKRWIERRYHSRVEKILLPRDRNGRATDLDVVGMQDDGKVLWMASPQTGMMGYFDGHWFPRTAFTLPSRIFLAATGAKAGQRWLATGDGYLVFSEGQTLISYDARKLGLATSINVHDEVVMGGDQGLAVLQKGHLVGLTADPPDILDNVSGMAITEDGDRWLNGGRGVVHVSHIDWSRSIENPSVPLHYELLGALDGYQGRAQLMNRLPSVYLSPSKELWFMTSVGVMRLNPDSIRRNVNPPTPQVLALRVGATIYSPEQSRPLPPGTKNLSIEFSVPALARPEATRVTYHLTGVDKGWQEAGIQRVANYTNIAPGQYVFRVRGWNEDGLQSKQDALLLFEISPTFSQTVWFKFLASILIWLTMYLLFRYRLQLETARHAEKMNTRLAERERIARTLHDTFLQSLQAIVMRVSAITDTLGTNMEAHERLVSVVDQARLALIEGREQVHELRLGSTTNVELVITELGQRFATDWPSVAFRFTVSGAPHELQSVVAEEICSIACEAIRNAFQHAECRNVDASLNYGFWTVLLKVQDNGKGMLKDRSADKHYGLVGMRERAHRAGGTLLVDSVQGAGTCVSLLIPARLAYRRARKWTDRLKRLV